MKQSILVCCGTNCLSAGASAVFDALKQAANGLDLEISPRLKSTGCNGLCENGPVVEILNDDGSDIIYFKVKPEDAREIINKTVLRGEIIPKLCYVSEDGKKITTKRENQFYAPQIKIALRNVGKIDPADINDYISNGGYSGFKKALEMSSEEIISEIKSSGLRGRGGAGFPTALKWAAGARQINSPKYIICNGDEGDPGAFMDGSIMEGDPHSLIEGMLIAALAVGSNRGFFYIRDEYIPARKSVETALEEARKVGYLGENILGSGFSFDAEIVRGGGAFICGEASALLESLEGRVGEPRLKPPRTSEIGLWGQPTVTNNVETLANVPVIIANGGEAFGKLGTETSKGTKVFAMVGKIKRTGLVEVPMGITLRELIFDIGGGIKDDRKFKAVQTGGPSGGCIPASMLDLTVDFDNLTRYGAMMGSGGMIVMDDTICMVEVARYYVDFLCEESCGKCTPCREGLRHMREILTEICEGHGQEGDVEILELLGSVMKDTSLCALGRTAPNSVLTAIKHFRDEFAAHIRDKFCPAGVCANLSSYAIDLNKCRGCGICAEICPSKAISGIVKFPYSIDTDLCISCGICRSKCNVNAIHVIRRDEKCL